MKTRFYFFRNKLLKTGFFHIFGSGVINKIISFLSSIILVHLLSKNEYGVFTYTWNIYSILILANGLGMDSAILQLCSEKNENIDFCNKITSYGLKIGFRFNIIICAVLVALGCFIPLSYPGANTLLKLICFLPIFQFLYSLICSVLRFQKNNRAYSFITVINTTCLLISSVIGALLFREKGLILGYYSAYTISIIFGNRYFKACVCDKSVNPERCDKKDLISIGFVAMVNNAISELLYLLDVFILGIVACDEMVLASYRVSTIIPTALSFIPVSFMIYVYPYFAEHKEDKNWCLTNYKKMVLGLGGFNFLLSLILFIGADIIVTLLFGDKYIDAVPVFKLLSINYFLSGTFRIVSGNLLVTQRKLKFNTIVAVASGIVNVVADYFFIQRWGSIGAALATILVVIVSSVMSTSYLVYILRKK